MSEIPPKASTPTTQSKRHHRKKCKYDKTKLPTPPPDPNPLEGRYSDVREKDVFDYLESIVPNYSKCTSTFAPVAATEEAFDHLEKLYKLMEQMLDLREQNAKLHRKIRDLEHLNKLEKLHRGIETGILQDGDYPDLDRDTAFAETVLEHILTDSVKKDPKQKPSTPTILRPSILRRNRSGSGQEKQVTLDANVIVQQEEGCEKLKNAKVSKWTRVKAAFRWEKASTSVSDSKSQDSGIHVPVNMEIARYLRVPSTSDDTGHSPADSGAAGITTPGSLSTASSIEDFQRTESRTTYEDFRCLDDDHLQQNYIPHPKDDQISNRSLSKPPRNPWTKMKDIISTRNSFKKKHRLSAVSDDIQIDVEFCSDNEDVFEDDSRSRKNASSNCSSRKNSLPLEVVERYQRALEEEKSESKWDRVKKAFITNYNSGNDSLRARRLKNARTLSENAILDPCSLEEEIHRDYKMLQKKLSLEFQEKVSEWERLKQNSPGTSSPSPSGFSEDNRDSIFMKKMEEWKKIKGQQVPRTPLPSEFDLPADFKKKLQEWEKIKKSCGNSSKKKLGDVPRWKSLSGNKPETPSFEYPQISEDFKKKLEEWKQIKASGGTQCFTDGRKIKDKTPSPKLSQKNSSPRQSKRGRDSDKDTQWFDKELGKIEKEKQRLERERQKFIEREARLSKLRRSVMGDNKKEVLIHTPSGFYKFEGISRKFTQKLYEWEKAQGIGPEASTFALLRSSYVPELKSSTTNSCTPPLVRSKSADSILSALNVTSPILSQQPSSLSLNDMEDLEKECMSDSKSSSLQYLLASQEDLEDSEPQAVLIEIEDYVEETAAPLQTFSQKQQLPVYQRQEFKTMCAGETIAAPKVRRSESAKAQKNYNLIEDIINVLKRLAENELEIRNTTLHGIKTNESKRKLKTIFDNQKHLSTKLSEQIVRLQDANSVVASSVSKDENSSHTNVNEILEAVQDLSNELHHAVEKMDQNIKTRTTDCSSTTNSICLQILENVKEIRSKILEIRRNLSYVCAASDTTVPHRKRSSKKKKFTSEKTVSNESKSSRCDTSDNSRKSSQKESKRYLKSENVTSSQGAVKKRIKYRQKTMMNKTIEDSDDEEVITTQEQQKMRQLRKICRTKTFSETESDKNTEEKEGKVLHYLEDVVIQTESNVMNVQNDSRILTESPLTVFVKTTRKLFTPIGEAHLGSEAKTSSSPTKQLDSPTIVVDSHVDEHSESQNKGKGTSPKKEENNQDEEASQVPPLPTSPIPQRKVFKEISPSIRIMLAKYNQKISEQDNKSIKSGNSSGSNSPLWRSPISERRVRCQTERYQEELNKLSPLLGPRKEVQKSASVGVLTFGNKHVTLPQRRDSIQEDLLSFASKKPPPEKKEKENNNDEEEPMENTVSKSVKKANLTLDLSLTNPQLDRNRHSPEVRQKKLQQAKEEFLNSTPTTASAHTDTEVLSFPARNRLSQISVGSESSCDLPCAVALMKSASAGMINVDPDTYKQIDPEFHGGGYVSLPRNSSLPKATGKFAFSNLASKFRKVKMRKGKDKDKKLSTVSALCRQSLVVDISESEDSNQKNDIGASTSRSVTKEEEFSLKNRIRMSLFKK